MATEQSLNALKAATERLEKIDSAKLLRRSLGEESLGEEFAEELKKILQLAAFVQRYAPKVHSDPVNQATSAFNAIAGLMDGQAALAPAGYIQNREQFIAGVKGQLEDATRWRLPFVVAAVEDRGFISDESIRDEYRAAVDDLRRESASTLTAIKDEAARSLQEAKSLAEEIEVRARRTATKISVREAQEQFQAASKELDGSVKKWSALSGVAICALVATAWAFMRWPLPSVVYDQKGVPLDSWPTGLYHTLLRVLILSAVGGASTFCVKMLRAHMHMAEKNRHRVRVANSIESFVNSALEPQQRDLILAKLTSEIVEFGESGLIRNEHDDHDSVLSADLLGRILATITKR